MILLDTNVLLYAIGGDHPLKIPCNAIVSAVGAATITAAIADISVSEFVHATSRRRTRSDTAALMNSLLGWVTEVITCDADVRRQALDLYVKHERLMINDAVIAATSMHFQTPLVTADRALFDVPDLRVYPPDAPEVLDPLTR